MQLSSVSYSYYSMCFFFVFFNSDNKKLALCLFQKMYDLKKMQQIKPDFYNLIL